MKHLTVIVLAAAAVMLAVCKEKEPAPAKTGTAGKPGVLIDVRTPEEFAAGHLEGALNIPYTEIGDRIGTQVPDQSAKIMVYCRTGRRSGIAKGILDKMGYMNVTNGGAFDQLNKSMPSVVP